MKSHDHMLYLIEIEIYILLTIILASILSTALEAKRGVLLQTCLASALIQLA